MSTNLMFDHVERRIVTFEAGITSKHTFLFPTFFRKSKCFLGAFLYQLDDLKKVINNSELVPLRVWGNCGVLAISAYQHEEVDEMEPYNEVVISTPIYKKGAFVPPLLPLLFEEIFSSFAHYVIDMPVTS